MVAVACEMVKRCIDGNLVNCVSTGDKGEPAGRLILDRYKGDRGLPGRPGEPGLAGLEGSPGKRLTT